MPPYKGPPWTIPSIGFSKRSLTPFPILVKSPTGFPRISIEPNTLKKEARRNTL